MTSTSLRLTMAGLFSLLLGACGDETGPRETAPAYAAPSETPAASQAPQAQDVGLTAEELAFDSESTAPSDPTGV